MQNQHIQTSIQTEQISLLSYRSQPITSSNSQLPHGATYGLLGPAGSRKSEVMDVLRNWQHITNGNLGAKPPGNNNNGF